MHIWMNTCHTSVYIQHTCIEIKARTTALGLRHVLVHRPLLWSPISEAKAKDAIIPTVSFDSLPWNEKQEKYNEHNEAKKYSSYVVIVTIRLWYVGLL
jgi:hypothetical protein